MLYYLVYYYFLIVCTVLFPYINPRKVTLKCWFIYVFRMVFVRNLLPKIGNRSRRRSIGSPYAHEMSQCRRNMVDCYRCLNDGRFHGVTHEDQRCGDIGMTYHLVLVAVFADDSPSRQHVDHEVAGTLAVIAVAYSVYFRSPWTQEKSVGGICLIYSAELHQEVGRLFLHFCQVQLLLFQ